MGMIAERADAQFWVGDARDCLAALPERSVHCVVTSPPYFSLRQYSGLQPSIWGGSAECQHLWGETVLGPTTIDYVNPSEQRMDHNGGSKTIAARESRRPAHGQYCQKCGASLVCLGLEESPFCWSFTRGANCGACFLCHLREVFAAVWRVLRDDGTCFVNLGDSYNAHDSGSRPKESLNYGLPQPVYQRGNGAGKSKSLGLKPKDRLGIPELFALAMRTDGWYWRDTIHLCKVAPMPESVTDRTTQAHEYLYVFSKRARYFWDAQAIRETAINEGRIVYATGDESKNGQSPDNTNDRRTAVGFTTHDTVVAGRNPRSWMLWKPEPTSISHFATFPRFLPSFCIRAGSSEHGVCGACGAPWERDVERDSHSLPVSERHGRVGHNGSPPQQSGWFWTPPDVRDMGWRLTCTHADAPLVPATVLDPFGGSATTAVVARELGRRSVYIDASETYATTLAIPRYDATTPSLLALTTPDPLPTQARLVEDG